MRLRALAAAAVAVLVVGGFGPCGKRKAEFPVTISRSTSEALVDWVGDTQVQYRKRPGYVNNALVVEARIEDPQQAFIHCGYGYPPTPGESGTADVIQALVALQSAPSGAPPVPASGEVRIRLGDNEKGMAAFTPLSDEVSIPYRAK